MNADQSLLHRWRDGDDGSAATNPLARRLGMRILEIDRPGQRIRLGFSPDQSLRDAGGTLSTTAIAAMLDFACGYVAMVALVPTHTVASSTLRIEWIADCDDDVVEAIGTIAGRSATTVFTRATLATRTTSPVALASSSLRIIASRDHQ